SEGMTASAHHADLRAHIEVLGIGAPFEGEAAGRRFAGRQALRVGKVAHDGFAHAVIEHETVHLPHAEQRHHPTFRGLANAADALELTRAFAVTAAAIRAHEFLTWRRAGVSPRRATQSDDERRRQ